MIRWSAHLHMLFKERPLLDRFQAAADAGFRRVECWSPFETPLDHFEGAVEDSGVELVGLNLHSGDMPAGDRGFLNLAERRDMVLRNAEDAVRLAQRLGTPNINALVGNRAGDESGVELREVEVRLGELAAIAEGTDATFLVEPLNSADNPRYLVNTPAEAAALLERVGAHPRLGMLFDAFQVARMGLDPAAELERYRGLVHHVQVADVPGRHAPGTGTIDWPAFFAALERIGYEGAVGLEYLPGEGQDTLAALEWLPPGERGASPGYPIQETSA